MALRLLARISTLFDDVPQRPLNPLEVAERAIRRSRWPKRLIGAVCVILVALFYCLGSPLKYHFCELRLPLPDTTIEWTQRALCSNDYASTEWNLSYHQGGNGPWIPKVDGVINDRLNLPEGCMVDQVHMVDWLPGQPSPRSPYAYSWQLARHAERYPTVNAGLRHLDLLERLRNSEQPLQKSLAFVKDWTYFTDPTDPEFESLIRTGTYSGTTEAENTGKTLRFRYTHLLHHDRSTKFWSCSSPRDIETANSFADGFFGPSWATDGSARLETIRESFERGSDTLTPGRTCFNYINDKAEGRELGYRALDSWQRNFTYPIIQKLSHSAPGFNLSPVDIYSMMEMCGFETLVRGISPWCNVFTNQEWLDFEYGRDLIHFYRAGPGNRYAGAMGWVWLNATLSLMLDDSDIAKSVYFSFVHDGDIIPLMATLGLLDEDEERPLLPMQRRRHDRRWRTSDVVPMGGRVIFERIKCRQALHPTQHTTYVRLLINDGHVNLTETRTGDLLPNDTWLAVFQDIVRKKGEKFGDFRNVCGLDKAGPDRISFLHQ